MSETVKVDTTNPDLFKPPEFPVLAPGVHTFAVSKISSWEDSKSEGNNKVKSLEFRCQDEDESKGLVVFERFVLIDPSDTSDKAAKARKINQQSMTTFCLACGVTTKEEVMATGELPIDRCLDAFFKAETKVVSSTYQGETRKRAEIKRYLYTDSDGNKG